MNKDLTQALSTLSNFALTSSVESTVNEQRDKEVKDRAHTIINSHLPAVAAVNNVDPNQMAKLYNIGSSTEIVANIDVFSNQIRKEAAGKAKLTPNMYNEELSTQVAPYLRLIDGMSGPDKQLAYTRLINGVAGAQGIQIKGNQQYKITEVKSLARSNVDSIIHGVKDLPEELQVGTLEEQLDTMTNVWLEKGMPIADVSKTMTEVVSGIIGEGDERATEILSKSSTVQSMVNQKDLAAAKVIGLKKIDHRLILENAPHLLSEADQEEAVKKMFVDYMKKNPNGSHYQFLQQNATQLSRFKPTVFSKNYIGSSDQYRKTGNKDTDLQVDKDRRELEKRVMSFHKGGMSTESIIANLSTGSEDMSSVIRNIVDGMGERSFDVLAASSIEAKFKARGVEEPKETLKQVTDQAVAAMMDMQDAGAGIASYFTPDLVGGTRSVSSTMTWKNTIQEDLRKYLNKNPQVDFTKDDWAQTFVDATYRADRIGNDTYLRKKGQPTFQENGESALQTQGLVKDLGYDILLPEITKQFDNTYDYVDVGRNNQITISRTADGEKLNIGFRMDKGVFDQWEDYPINSMYRLDFTGDEPKVEILPRELGTEVRSSLDKQQEYFDQGWRPTTPDGKIQIDIQKFQDFRLMQGKRKSIKRKSFIKSTGMTPEERQKQSAAVSSAFY